MVQLHRRAARHGARGQDQGRGRGGAAAAEEEEKVTNLELFSSSSIILLKPESFISASLPHFIYYVANDNLAYIISIYLCHEMHWIKLLLIKSYAIHHTLNSSKTSTQKARVIQANPGSCCENLSQN